MGCKLLIYCACCSKSCQILRLTREKDIIDLVDLIFNILNSDETENIRFYYLDEKTPSYRNI